MPLETVIGEDAAQIGVAGKQDAVQVPGLPLPPTGGREDPGRRGHGCRLIGAQLDPDTLVLAQAQEMIDHLEAPLAARIIDAADIDQLAELAIGVVTQEGQHRDDGVPVHRDGQLALRDLGARYHFRQRAKNVFAEFL